MKIAFNNTSLIYVGFVLVLLTLEAHFVFILVLALWYIFTRFADTTTED